MDGDHSEVVWGSHVLVLGRRQGAGSGLESLEEPLELVEQFNKIWLQCLFDYFLSCPWWSQRKQRLSGRLNILKAKELTFAQLLLDFAQ